MNLYIIGNGFDLFHNMTTSYENFRNYLLKKDECFLNNFEELYTFNGLHGNDNEEWAYLEENLPKWDIDQIEANIENQIDNINELEGGYCDGIELPEGTKYYNALFNSFLDYFYKWINEENNKFNDENFCKKFNEIIKFNKEKDLFFSFNYTKILENFYGIKTKNICHIHGICDDKDSIILGCNKDKHETYLCPVGKNNKESNNYTEITDYINNLLSSKVLKDSKKELEKNKNFFKKIKKAKINKIIVIGHSVNEIDLPYYKEIKKLKDNQVWKIFYYNKESILSIRNNLNKINVNNIELTNYPTINN